MAYYPIAIDIAGAKVLVVGGGTVALRKIESLLEFGAEAAVVSPETVPGIDRLASDHAITLLRRSYVTDDIAGVALAIAATDDRRINQQVSEDCRAAGILVNVADDPNLCTFTLQSIIKRGDLVISIGSSGKSPALCRKIREMIEPEIGPEYERLTDLMGRVRELVKTRIACQSVREQVLKRALDSAALDLLRDGRYDEAEDLAFGIVEEAISSNL